MQLKISFKKTLLIISIAEIILSLTVIFFSTLVSFSRNFSAMPTSPATNQNPQILTLSNSIESSSFPKQERPELPARLKIPKINVDAAIEYIGLTPEGAMDAPKNPDNVAWFSAGQRPGENGSAVVAGHYGIKNNKPSVFDNLYKLRKGDKLYVEDKKGLIITFVVRESRRYDPNANASSVFGSKDGKPHLNLITCEGVWNEVSKSYSVRLVVFTDKE